MLYSNDRVNNSVINQYFRTSDDTLQIDWRLSESNTVEDWRTCCEELAPSFGVALPDSMGRTPDNDQLLVGELLLRYNQKCLENKSMVDAQSSLRSRLQALELTCDQILQTISDAFFDAAEERGWCPLATDLIKELNEDLPSNHQLPMRNKAFPYKWKATITVDIEGESTINSSSIDNANDKLREFTVLDHVDSYAELRELVAKRIQSSDWEEVETSAEVEED